MWQISLSNILALPKNLIFARGRTQGGRYCTGADIVPAYGSDAKWLHILNPAIPPVHKILFKIKDDYNYEIIINLHFLVWNKLKIYYLPFVWQKNDENVLKKE